MAQIRRIDTVKFAKLLMTYIDLGEKWIDMEIISNELLVRPSAAISEKKDQPLTDETIIKNIV